VVVQESEEEDLALLVRLSRMGQPGAVHGIALPQVAKGRPLEATVGFGPLLSQQLGGGGSPFGQVPAQSAVRYLFFGDGVGLIQAQHGGNGASRTEGLLPFKRFGPVQGLD
jgi:hypothetical protein